MNKKVLGILEGAVIIALGVLIAVFGGQAVLDIYFVILFLIAGVSLLVVACVGLAKTKELSFGLLFLAFAGLVLGTFLLAKYYSFAYLVYTLVLLVIAAGAALIFYGVYYITKKNTFTGVGQVVIGALAITFGTLYIFVPEFQKWFWIVIGVLVAVYGVFYIVNAAMSKNK